MSEVWDICKGFEQISPIQGLAYRLVEDQHQVATVGYSESMAEQKVLEDIIEESKPHYQFNAPLSGMHYLLKTPFRYPPLKYGSRFGSRDRRGIFYGGCSVESCLVESAFYRMIHWDAMNGCMRKSSIKSQHTLLKVSYNTEKGISLQKEPFSHHENVLTDQNNYSITQQLGSTMRDSGVEAVEYTSARDPRKGICVALFSPEAFGDRMPGSLEKWICEVGSGGVSFKSIADNQVHMFPVTTFLLKDGSLPYPAD